MSHTKHMRSTFGISEQMPLDSVSGSIGTTKPGKYTDVARNLRFVVQRRAGT
jgi:hypothetical protein